MTETQSWLALDVGTHAVRAGLVLADGSLADVAQQPVALQRLDERRVEQDPGEILAALRQVTDAVLARNRVPVAGAGLACQRSTVLAWRRSDGRALGPALSWQDTRGWQQVESLRTQEEEIRRRSGLVLSPHYGASKLHELQVRYAAEGGDLCLSPLIAYLLHHLLRERPCVCDEGNAGRMQLWNLEQRCWDPLLLDRFAVQPHHLPEVRPTLSRFGTLSQAEIPLLAAAGDQNAALCGTLTPAQQDRALANLGSGAFALSYSGVGAAPTGLLRGLAYSTAEECRGIWEGTVNGAGLALSWLARQPEVAERGGESWLLAHLPQWLADSALLPAGAIFHNSVGGLGSPFWRTGGAAGFSKAVQGLEAQAVAVVESIVFLLAINLRALRRAKPEIERVCVTGGLARLDGLCQRLADLLQMPVVRLAQPEATLIGCARMASGFRLPLPIREDARFQPAEGEALQGRYQRFQDWLHGVEHE